MPTGFLKIEAFKANFFDRQKVTNAVDRATQRNLSKFGAFVRTRARSSIRKRKRVSQPGQPPSAHTTGSLSLRSSIFFALGPDKQSVVIGPVLFNGADAASPVPERLEYGGETTIKRRGRKPTRARYRARPFMGPAFEKEKQQLPAIWRDSVK